MRLTADLQRARERIVAAREEERRTLRRDLHDGIGPTLAGITLQVDVARSLLRTDAAAARAHGREAARRDAGGRQGRPARRRGAAPARPRRARPRRRDPAARDRVRDERRSRSPARGRRGRGIPDRAGGQGHPARADRAQRRARDRDDGPRRGGRASRPPCASAPASWAAPACSRRAPAASSACAPACHCARCRHEPAPRRAARLELPGLRGRRPAPPQPRLRHRHGPAARSVCRTAAGHRPTAGHQPGIRSLGRGCDSGGVALRAAAPAAPAHGQPPALRRATTIRMPRCASWRAAWPRASRPRPHCRRWSRPSRARCASRTPRSCSSRTGCSSRPPRPGPRRPSGCPCRWPTPARASGSSRSAWPKADELSAADRLLLGGLARQAGVAAHAVQIASDLQRSRERLVTAREEERRRLRRDLHDGLGPHARRRWSLQLQVADHLIATGSGAADAALSEVKAAARAAVGDIRRLVYELRPPGARRTRSRRRARAPGRGVRVARRPRRGAGARGRRCPPPSRWPPTASRWRP